MSFAIPINLMYKHLGFTLCPTIFSGQDINKLQTMIFFYGKKVYHEIDYRERKFERKFLFGSTTEKRAFSRQAAKKGRFS